MALPIILTIVTYFSDKDIILFQLLFPGFDTHCLFAMQPRCHGRASCFPSPWISTHSERLMKQRSHCCTLYPAHFPASKDVWYLARLCRRRRDCDVLLASSIFFQWRRRFFLSTRNWNAVDFCQASVNWTIFFSPPFIFLSTERERGEKLTS